MKMILRGTAALLALSSLLLCAQDGAARKTGTIYKGEVDGLIAALRGPAPTAPLGGSSVVATAKILTAMGHCHRRYHKTDGPVVRPSLAFLIRSRQANGSFGHVVDTAWAVEALQVMDAEGYAEEIKQAREWLSGSRLAVPGFEQQVATILGNVRADLWPQHMAGSASERAAAWIAAPATLDRARAAESLLDLVACQTANRRLDRAAASGQQGSDTFTPSQQKAFDWLLAQQQDGVFMGDPALTGFGLLALQTKPEGKRTAAEQAVIDAGLKWLLTTQNDDGTFGDRVPNYTTCVVVAALVRSGDVALKPVLARAQKAILTFQHIEASGYEQGDRDYGSIGYGSSQRGDLSNLHFSVEALRATGLDEDHEAFAKAIVFLQRTQNLKSHNDFKGKVPDPDKEGEMIDAVSGDDGGATYYPGNSNAGYLVRADGKSIARSYGSMTYALLKAYILCGLPADDERVQAAVGWIQKNWDLATNPGSDPAMAEKTKYAGLFYYYMVLAQALSTVGVEHVEIERGTTEGGELVIEEVDWREALQKQLEGMQQADGTWINGKNDRWMEGMPLLCTCYAMVALERCNK